MSVRKLLRTFANPFSNNNILYIIMYVLISHSKCMNAFLNSSDCEWKGSFSKLKRRIYSLLICDFDITPQR